MRYHLAAAQPLIALAIVLAGQPAAAQTAAERSQYEPLQGFAIEEYQKENKVLTGLREQLGKETDLVRGCGLLRDNVTHLEALDKILSNLVLYATKLRQNKERKIAEGQQTATREEIALRKGDIEKLCGSVTAPSVQ